MTNAPITPGIHPHNVNRQMITMDPHPLSRTAKGGKITDRITLNKLMVAVLLHDYNNKKKSYSSGKSTSDDGYSMKFRFCISSTLIRL